VTFVGPAPADALTGTGTPLARGVSEGVALDVALSVGAPELDAGALAEPATDADALRVADADAAGELDAKEPLADAEPESVATGDAVAAGDADVDALALVVGDDGQSPTRKGVSVSAESVCVHAAPPVPAVTPHVAVGAPR